VTRPEERENKAAGSKRRDGEGAHHRCWLRLGLRRLLRLLALGPVRELFQLCERLVDEDVRDNVGGARVASEKGLALFAPLHLLSGFAC
jgi:hypothetical protein